MLIDESYTYDNNFNVETLTGSIGGSNVFGYDSINRMVTVSNGGAASALNYDDHGNLVSSAVAEFGTGDNQFFAISGASLKLEFAGGLPALGQSEFSYDSKGTLMHEDREDGSSVDYFYLAGRLVAKNTNALSLGADSDTDGDGIDDLTEGFIDSDGDGVANYEDIDSDGNGVLDSIEGSGDEDNDGIADYADSDNDGDGRPDIDEDLGRNPNCDNGEYTNFDSNTGWVTLADTVGGVTEQRPFWMLPLYSADGDVDGDGLLNPFDSDSDGDGISNEIERAYIPPADMDCDGLPHWYDLDSDGDTWSDEVETDDTIPFDIDGDGKPNFLDLDSDNDGNKDEESEPVSGLVAEGKLLYIDTKLEQEGGLNIARASVTLGFMDVLNRRGLFTAITLPANSDSLGGGPDFIELQVQTEEISYTPSDPNNIPGVTCKEIKPPYLCSSNCGGGGGGGGGLGGSGWLPWCSAAEPAVAVPNSVIHTYRFEPDSVFQNLAGRTVIFEVAATAKGAEGTSANDVGSLDMVDIYNLPIEDPVTKQPLVFDGSVLQFLPARFVVSTGPYVRTKNTPTLETNATCCLFHEGTGQLYSDETSATIDKYHQSGQRILISFPNFFWDRGEEQYGILYTGIVDTTDSYFYLIENHQQIYADTTAKYGNVFASPFVNIILVEVVSPAIADSGNGTLRYIELGDSISESGPGDPNNPNFNGAAFITANTAVTAKIAEPVDYRTDTDGDGIHDFVEIGIATHPFDTDSDGVPDYLDLDSDADGISDEIEARANGLIPLDTDQLGVPNFRDTDSDQDGLPDELETQADPDLDYLPNYIDTDSDGDIVPDSVEGGIGADGQLSDLDGDGVPDSLDQDADNDGLSDFYEAGPDPANPLDSDNDGLPDYLDTDSDNDGITDGEEYFGVTDTDGDGLPDEYELSQGLDPNDASDATTDLDGDGLNNIQEYQAGTSPNLIDTDSDGMPDGYEVNSGSDPLIDDGADDSDGDGISIYDEYLASENDTSVVYRVNAGGPELLDSIKNWEADTDSDPSMYVQSGDARSTSRVIDVSNLSIPQDTPEAIFSTKRRDKKPAPDMAWSFPVTPGAYEVRLYFTEFAQNSGAIGERLISVSLEGKLALANYDIFADTGFDAGVMQSFKVFADASLDISFLRSKKNPVVSGIENLSVDPAEIEVRDPAIVHRINAGGPALLAGDWEADSTDSPSPYVNTGDARETHKVVKLVDASLPLDTPASLFASKKRDKSAGDDMAWSLPVLPGTYEVRLFFTETAKVNYGINERKFDVILEGSTALKKYDVYARAGAQSGVMERFEVNSDEFLDIAFLRRKGNPIINGIEVRRLDVDYLYRINVGGSAILQQGWLPDSQSEPSPFVTSGSFVSSDHLIDLTDASVPDGTPELLFQTRRRTKSGEAPMQWALPVEPGDYQLRLYFSEFTTANFAVGKRLIDVSVDGMPALLGYDVFAEVGGDKGIVKSFDISADTEINIVLPRNKKNPTLSAIEVIPANQ